jgi:hypothetical protein
MYYKIADWLADEQKRRIVEQAYTDKVKGHPTTADGWCPLGFAGEYPAHQDHPYSDDVASLIYNSLDPDDPRLEEDDHRGGTRDIWLEIADAAEEFIVDWDDNRIPPERLAEALGL